ncbi:hypothetical protein RJ641_006024, partial [Dillenia turbinata]
MVIMSTKIHSPFLGIPLQSTFNGRKNVGLVFDTQKGKYEKRVSRKCITCEKRKNDYWMSQWIRFSHLFGRNIDVLRNNLNSRSIKVNSVQQSFARSKALVKSFTSPLWEEGLFLVRCSVFAAVISGVCLLVWFGQKKAKGFIEAKLLPSVCSVLSEYVQREIDFGKVRSVSPLSVTLEMCSIGPRGEEFSCGEVPTMKIRIHPFSSLRRGRIVIDAVLSHPSLLVVQKKDFTWLGIPSTEGSLSRHCSTEEGIDYRTKTRRIAREEVIARWNKDRDEAAREAAEIGYIVHEQVSIPSNDNGLMERAIDSTRVVSSHSFFCMDERMHWRDHHCLDTGVEYDTKHADLEKAFGVKELGSEPKFWSKIRPPTRFKFNKKSNRKEISAADITAKKRILERSAAAGHAFFQGLSVGELSESLHSSRDNNLSNLDVHLTKREVETNGYSSNAGVIGEVLMSSADHRKIETEVDYPGRQRSSEADDYKRNDIVSGDDSCRSLSKYANYHSTVLGHPQDPPLKSIGKCYEDGQSCENLPSDSDIIGPTENQKSQLKDKALDVHFCDVHNDTMDRSSKMEGHVIDYLDAKPDFERGHEFQGESSNKLDTWIPIQSSSGKAAVPDVCRNVGELLSYFIAGSIQKLKARMGKKVDDIVSELAEEVDEMQTEGIEKLLPVTVDSVYFRGGALMLLAYGDREPREMENVSGHIKFQNHYGRVHVQLSGNCKMWRSEVPLEDGGWLSADVFVDIVEQKWHANLKIANLFAPLFERILEIPISWSRGRASGEVRF